MIERIELMSTAHPFTRRREEIGMSLPDLQAKMSARGFHYPVDTIGAIERGERSFPLEMPGFTLAMSECLEIPVSTLYNTARASTQALRSKHMFVNRVQGLRPQNQALLRLLMKHPNLTLIPGFNFWFELAQSIALQLPDSWFAGN